jgi:hypothetical protein
MISESIMTTLIHIASPLLFALCTTIANFIYMYKKDKKAQFYGDG